ncbi:hypothetical protein V6N13_074915 [Hibiscus sabdariffa]|uniref:Putative plant transposon protein domain-containing protein n=1 Tax=Hibiscus sabdariffa TaxID=183260 RepID=A0ABR2UAG3_9ROSI
MPTSHNQTVDQTRLVLINAIITGYRFNIGEVIAQELAAACRNDKGILAFPCIITALCRRAAVPAYPGDKHTIEKLGWSRKEYMRKMDITNTTPIRIAMPTHPTSPVRSTAAAHDEAGPSARVEAQTSPAATPQASPALSATSTPAAMPASRNQLQRIEARQLQFKAETKVFHQNLINFLCFQFPSTAIFFNAQPEATPVANRSVATQPIPSANPSTRAGDTEEVHLSSDYENDIFDWQSPREHLHPIGPTSPRIVAPAEVPILSPAPTPANSAIVDRTTPDSPTQRKGKALAGRTVSRHALSSPDEEEQLHRPAKRQRRYHIITADSDDDSSEAVPVSQPEKSTDPSLSSTF